MIRPNRIRFYLTLLLVISIIACQSRPYYESVTPVSNNSWSYDDALTYKFSIPDTLTRYNLSISTKHTKSYPYANLWVKTTTVLPDKTRKEANLELNLAEIDGKWIGKGMGNTKLCINSIQEGFHFDQIGEYEIIIHQNMRTNPLTEIRAIGLILEKYN